MSLHTKNISFAGQIGQNIIDDDYKRQILSTIGDKFNVHVLKKHHGAFDMDYVKRVPNVVCLRSNGNPYFMYLTQYNDKNMCIFIDKKIQTSYSLPRMVCVPFQIHHSLFLGTVFDGEMVKDTDDQWLFLINDMVALKGVSISHMNFSERLVALHGVLKSNFKSSFVDVCAFQVKRYVTFDKIDELVNKFPLSYTNRGLIFKPLYTKFQELLFNFDDTMSRVNPVAIDPKLPKKIIIVRGPTIDSYVSKDCDVFVRTLENSLKIREMFKGQPVNKQISIDCVWNECFSLWELVVID